MTNVKRAAVALGIVVATCLIAAGTAGAAAPKFHAATSSVNNDGDTGGGL